MGLALEEQKKGHPKHRGEEGEKKATKENLHCFEATKQNLHCLSAVHESGGLESGPRATAFGSKKSYEGESALC